ncbi:hypothetical protein TSUD_38400 [Trifolium subterraneum]|uniref:Kinesin motor domain-containing protein n=1 Tax=Trifolium subterraneum TaxID=3900 RepID=A0A2Z6MPJ9_TRISU|nr:hypothetical protein TSUD_38400 [Trifolium subterraneum]
MVGVVAAKDLPAEPSEEEFRLGLRSGIILCNVLNKVQPGAVSKVVESPVDSGLIPDGAPLSAFQYFENVRNFLVAVQEIGIPTFEASDLEQGGKSSRIVNSVLALKSYSEWKQTGANGVWKFSGTIKPAISTKSFTKTTSRGAVSQSDGAVAKFTMARKKVDNKISIVTKKEEFIHKNHVADEESKKQLIKQQMLFDQRQKDIQELKLTVQTTKAGMQFMQMKFHEEFSNLGSIRVYCRVRPFLSGQSNHLSTVENIEDGVITINVPSKNGKGRKSFNFNKVFGPSAAQGEVFADMQPLVRSVLDGFNVCIFAYGQTGSGKTFTMTGIKKNHEIRSNSQRGLSVPDASLVQVSSTNDVIELMNLGHKNRAVGATALNDRSSRSHSCLTVHVQGRDLTSGAVLRGCMHLVDLAGSERVDKSEATGDRLKEAQHINKSLSALGDVIASLAQKNQHVPYRNSKLTQLLQDSLGGQAKTLMFVHISPETNAIGETISTLKFAERVATVELGAARVNKDGADVKELKDQIASLKAQLARKEGNSEHSISGSSGKYRTAASELSPYHASQRAADIVDGPFGFRQPMFDVGNLELQSNTTLRQKTQSIDFDEILTNSPRWPPVNGLVQNCAEDDDDKETGTGEWVDKVMVNKLDVNKTGNMLGHWESDNGNLSEEFYQKYLQDSSKVYSERSYNMFMRGNQFNIAGSDDTDDVDAATSDSSEHDLLWQFNHSKVTSIANGNESKGRKLVSKSAKSPAALSKNGIHSSTAPSPSRKQMNGVSHRTPTRQPVPVDMKRKTGSRK